MRMRLHVMGDGRSTQRGRRRTSGVAFTEAVELLATGRGAGADPARFLVALVRASGPVAYLMGDEWSTFAEAIELRVAI